MSVKEVINNWVKAREAKTRENLNDLID